MAGGQRRDRRGLLRRRTSAALTVVVMVAVAGPTGAVAVPSVAPTAGTASSQLLRVNPTAGELSIGVTVGRALAGHQNTGGQAEARGLDLGLIGQLLSEDGCDGGDPMLDPDLVPAPLQVESSGSAAPAGEQELQLGLLELAGSATSGTDAGGRSSAAVLEGVGVPGVMEVRGGVAEAWSGTGAPWTSGAVSVLGSVQLLGGLVSLTGLEWRAEVRGDATDDPGSSGDGEGTFSVGGVEVLGIPLPVSGELLGPVAPSLSSVLAPLGIVLELPEVIERAGSVEVTPLRVGIGPAPTKDALLGAVLEVVRPVRNALGDTAIEADCSLALPFTVLDVVAGAVSGAGRLELELGGVRASGEALTLVSLPSLPDLAPPGPTTMSTPGAVGEPGGRAAVLPAPPPLPGPSFTPVGTDGDGAGEVAAVVPASPVAAGRAGPLTLVALVGLAAIALAAAADARSMLRATRTIPDEVSPRARRTSSRAGRR